MSRARFTKTITIIFIVLGMLSQAQLGFSQATGLPQGDSPENMPFVTVTRIDSTNFPRVSAYVAVIGKDGNPVKNLTAQDFHLTEDEIEVANKSVEVIEENSQGFNMALAVDISTYKPETLEIVRQALKSFIKDLSSNDRVSLMVFHNEVEILVPLTGDKKVLNQAVDNLQATGTRTALNAAIIESVDAASAFKPGRGVAVVITNKPENVGKISSKEVINHVEQMGIPVYTICYGDTQSAHLPDVTRLTRGRHFDITSPNEVQISLETVRSLLRQGYKVTFDSELFADDKEHTLVVTYQQLAKRAQGPFQALSGNITISVSGLEDQQQIARGDEVLLSAKVNAPGDAVHVTYSVDGQTIAQREQSPYDITLSSISLEPGKHTLQVHAADNVNNTQQKQIDFKVVEPIVIKDFQVPDNVKAGEPITATVWVETLDEVDEVTFTMDEDKPSYSENATSPYSYIFASDKYTTGTHAVSVQIVDKNGREKWTGVRIVHVIDVKTEATEEKPSNIGLIALITITTLALIGVLILLFLLFTHFQRRQSQAIYPMEIANLGNIKNHYELRAEDSTGQLKFEFIHNGIELTQAKESRVVTTIPVAQQVTVISTSNGATNVTPIQKISPNVSDAKDKIAQTKRGAHGVATFLGAIASALPFTRDFLSPIIATLAQGERTMTQTERTARRAEQTRDLVKKPFWKKSTATQPTEAILKSSTTPSTPTTQAQSGKVISMPNTFSPTLVPALSWAQTPDIAPGETLKLNLAIQLPRGFVEWDPQRNKHQAQIYSFEVQSRPAQQHQDTKTITQDIQIIRTPWYKRVYPWLALIIFVAAATIFYLAILNTIV
ncbi:MAG: VWA domain-containing protein [Anaerolineae bacterium]|nr:VWA domain-containing protein [Anaerolineae bacterium]